MAATPPSHDHQCPSSRAARPGPGGHGLGPLALRIHHRVVALAVTQALSHSDNLPVVRVRVPGTQAGIDSDHDHDRRQSEPNTGRDVTVTAVPCDSSPFQA